MVDQLTFADENRERIRAIENSFGPAGKSLYKPDRILLGEGRLTKQSRRGQQPKVFFLFNDVLVYGSIILNGRWYKNQQIIPLEEIKLEDLEDGFRMKNQWLIRTPRKSFYVAASSSDEKQAWIEHMEDCRARLLQSGRRASSAFAVAWVPDHDSAICMRCKGKFNVTHRRHHCRKCGFVVCARCSKKKAVIEHIHPTKELRICTVCHSNLDIEANSQDMNHKRDSIEKSSSDEDEPERSSDEDNTEEEMEDHDPSKWMYSEGSLWSPYVYIKPEQLKH
ncbi:pleckstrin homology domain-containing family F member 1 [Betta splendens]|uniref:Pleckstrin homology domain-containing family F member 1 n=1 Tax=Betta splendens TaxID=158456 RepID=A0A6P7M4U9_BETSP|nr:pleckstrin homology domain-containing family F member 1 [Betta splendens]